MNNSTYRFTLDLQKHNSQMSIAVYRYDNAVRLLISLTDGGKPYTIEEGSYAIFYGKRADNESLTHNCMIRENTEIIYDFEDSTACVDGIVNCQIRLYGTDHKLITAPRFIIVVEERVVTDEDIEIDDDTKSALDEIFLTENERILAEEDRVEAESARVLAEEARVTAEATRAEAEASRVLAENSRVSSENARVTAEASRVSAEKSRTAAESVRVSNENARVQAENERASAEASRVATENARADAEAARVKAENERVTAESLRDAAEKARTSAWVRYSAYSDGTDYTETWSEGKNYIGVSASHDCPTSKSGFVWSLFKGEKGDPFTIAKVYSSVNEMESDFLNTAVAEGSFVAIDTGNVDDEDNAKLYVKSGTGFLFITDLSGAQGLKGEKGEKGEQGPQGEEGRSGIDGAGSRATTILLAPGEEYELKRNHSYEIHGYGDNCLQILYVDTDENALPEIDVADDIEATISSTYQEGSNVNYWQKFFCWIKTDDDWKPTKWQHFPGPATKVKNIHATGTAYVYEYGGIIEGNSEDFNELLDRVKYLEDNPTTGPQGEDGKDGTSVTITNVTESSEDGGSNVVTFSNGQTLTVKNGSKGSTGATGATGATGEKGDGLTVITATVSGGAAYIDDGSVDDIVYIAANLTLLLDGTAVPINFNIPFVSSGTIEVNHPLTIESTVGTTTFYSSYEFYCKVTFKGSLIMFSDAVALEGEANLAENDYLSVTIYSGQLKIALK